MDIFVTGCQFKENALSTKIIKREKTLSMPDIEIGPLQYSTMFTVTPEITGGSVLSCQCGWKGTVVMATEIHHHTKRGARKKTHYCCPNSMHILAEVAYNPPITLAEMREAHDIRTDNSGSIVTFE